MSSSFGQWYDNQRAGEGGSSSSPGGSLFASLQQLGDTENLLPMFNTESMQSMQNLSLSSMKASMEAQMPQQVLGMGYQQRFKVFCGLLFLSALFFALAFFVGMPMIAIRPQKFALSFTMGSIMFMGSFAILKGPKEHFMGMIQADRLPFTTVYLGSLLATLYITFNYGGASGYVFVIAASGAQLLALLWYLISFIPGGAAGMKYLVAVMATLLKPVFIACAKMQAYCITKCFGWYMSSGSSSS